MVIVEVPIIIDSTLFSHEEHKRSGGLHVSHIIKSIEEDMYGIFKGEGIASQKLEAYRAAGFLFERALYDVILKDQNIERLGEFVVDGIVLTPDAINLTTSRGIESKCTWRSMGHDVTDRRGEFASWWLQILSYAKALNLLSWDLYVMFMCGDYKTERAPTPRHWEIELTDEDIDSNWRQIRNHAQWMIETGKVQE